MLRLIGKNKQLKLLVRELQTRLAIQPGSIESSEVARWRINPATLLVDRNSQLGIGSNGGVYQGSWYNWPVAAKTLSKAAFPNDYGIEPGTPTHDQMIAEFNQEVQILLHVRHPNLVLFFGVTYKDIGGYQTPEYLVTERATRSLQDLLRSMPRTPLPLQVVIRYTKQVLKAINHLHLNDVMHRDIKPANILIFESDLGGEDVMKVCDVGASKLLEVGESQTRTFVGTPAYVAPEILTVLTTGRAYSNKVDVFSCGVTIAEMMCGWVGTEPPPRDPPFPVPPDHSLLPLLDMTLKKDPDSRWTIKDALDFLQSRFP